MPRVGVASFCAGRRVAHFDRVEWLTTTDPSTQAAALRGNGMDAWFGWPTAPKLEAIRDQWLREPDMAMQKRLAAKMQRQAFEDAPCMPLGLYYQPVAYRADLSGMMKGLISFTWVRRGEVGGSTVLIGRARS